MQRPCTWFTIILVLILKSCIMENRESQPTRDKGEFPAGMEGNVLGTIYNPDGSRAAGAVVRLVSSGHVPGAPLAKINQAADSVVTDEQGHFNFLSGDNGYYNLLAKGDKGLSFKDSVYIRDQVTIQLNATLESPGSVQGVARLPFGNKDNSGIVILVLGTNLYTVPQNAGGQFQTPPLASGRYTLRLLTTQPGYGFLDTEVVITKGATHILQDTLFLPATGPKRIDSIMVTLDNTKMEARVSWPAFPPDLIGGYNVYRSSPEGNNQQLNSNPVKEPLYVDRVMSFEGNTISYVITTVDKDGQETLPSPARSVRIESALKADTIRITAVSRSLGDLPFAEDTLGNFYFIGDAQLYKLNSLGEVLTKFSIPTKWAHSWRIFTSRNGFVYVVTHIRELSDEDRRDRYTRVLKFDASLAKIDSLTIPYDVIPPVTIISPEGMLYHHNRGKLEIYDNSFTLLRTDSSPYYSRNLQVMNDTLLVQDNYWLRSETDTLLRLYDRDMNFLGSPGIGPRLFSNFPWGDDKLAVYNIIRTRDGRYVLSARGFIIDYIMVFNADLELQGTKIVPSSTWVFVNDKDDIRYYEDFIGIITLKF